MRRLAGLYSRRVKALRASPAGESWHDLQSVADSTQQERLLGLVIGSAGA